MTEVLIVGAGPAGLMLAAELRLAGVATTVVEREAQRPPYVRSFTLNARSLDLLARRGLAGRLIAEGWPAPHAAFSGLPVTLGLAGTHTDHPFTLGIPQTRVEEVLEEHATALGARILRGYEFRELAEDPDGIGDGQLRAQYLVGCDGGRSTVRKLAGIGFPGTPSTRFWLLGDVEIDADLPYGLTTGPGGTVFVLPRPGHVRVVADDPDPSAPVTLQRLQSAVDGALGRHVALSAPRWLTRFGNAARQAEQYVRGRVILAGDAAHIHPPAGAIGMSVALDDAVNLGWKLAATVRGHAPAHVLASYHHERHAAGAGVLTTTQAQLQLGTAAPDPVAGLLGRMAAHPAGNRALAEIVTGLDTRYDMLPAGDHPWLGRLVPNLEVETGAGGTDVAAGTDVATLLRAGRPLLLDLSDLTAVAAGWGDRVDIVRAACPGRPDLAGVLLRPDGHAAWLADAGEPGPLRPEGQAACRPGTGEPAGGGLREALEHWHGPPGPA